MRVFGIEPDDKFKEYVRTPFQVKHEETILEKWLESNPDGIIEDGKLLIIGRQVRTNLGGFIDLLALDQDGKVVIIVMNQSDQKVTYNLCIGKNAAVVNILPHAIQTLVL